MILVCANYTLSQYHNGMQECVVTSSSLWCNDDDVLMCSCGTTSQSCVCSDKCLKVKT